MKDLEIQEVVSYDVFQIYHERLQINLWGIIKTDRNTIENKIKQYKAEMIRDEKMMDKEPRNMFWCEDYNLNSSLLESYENMKKDVK